MKKFTAILALCCAFFFVTNTIQGQDYKSAVGLRLSYPYAISYKTFISEKAALEGFLSFRGYTGYSWIQVGGLYQYHKPISSVENLKWYIGGGAAASFYNYSFTTSAKTFGVSILGNAGLDYKFNEFPLNLSLDWIPVIPILGGYDFYGGWVSLTARYILK